MSVRAGFSMSTSRCASNMVWSSLANYFYSLLYLASLSCNKLLPCLPPNRK
jgi:hypothetical protein